MNHQSAKQNAQFLLNIVHWLEQRTDLARIMLIPLGINLSYNGYTIVEWTNSCFLFKQSG